MRKSPGEKGFRWQEALLLFYDAPRPRLSSVNAAMSACAKCLQWPMALQIFQEMPMRRLKPDRTVSHSRNTSNDG